MKRTGTLVGLILMAGCALNSDAPPRASSEVWQGELQVHGALRKMFHEGQINAQVTLDTLLPNQDLYAVGALAGLSGEVTVVAGKVYLSYPETGDATRNLVQDTSSAGATLLVSTAVPRWRSFTTQRAISFAELDEQIALHAAAAGLRAEDRFPFMIEGNFENLAWHVIDGSRLKGGGGSHQDHLAAAAHGRRERTTAKLIGFHSPGDEGVFTHMGSRTHVHCVLSAPLESGHVDHVDIPAGVTLSFPVVGSQRSREHGRATLVPDELRHSAPAASGAGGMRSAHAGSH